MDTSRNNDPIRQARALMARGRFRQASGIINRSLRRAPGQPELLMLGARALQRRGRHARALAMLNQIPGDPSPAAALSIAWSLSMLGRHRAALSALSAARAIHDDPGLLAALIDKHLDLGERQAAGALLEAGALGDPIPADTPPPLAIAWARADGQPAERLIEQLAPIAEAHLRDKAIRFTLARLHEDARQYDAAFAAASSANAIDPPPYRKPIAAARVEQLLGAVKPATLPLLNRPPQGPGPRPILIVGMPRSGTSLVEQILSAHPAAAAAGESQALPELVMRLSEGADARTMFSRSTLTGPRLAGAREIYRSELAAAGGVDPDSPPRYITDKNPMNLFLLAHALAITPDAVVIRVRRDPRDVCLSCFMSPLAADHTYKHDLADCAHFALGASRVLDHFQTIASEDPRATWIDIGYERLASDPSSTIDELLDSLGLDPCQACSEFHDSSRIVSTISRDQVREPMHTRSVGRWRRYAHLPEVQAMLALLDEASATP